jgi:riboflavin kinase/FMN adenylyltransferase
MRIVRQLEEVPRDAAPMALAVGVFDGVHVGHRRVLAEARARGRAAGGQSWALTFEPHPRRMLRPERPPARITPPDLLEEQIAAAGMDGLIVLPFTPGLAAVEAEDFVEDLVRRLPGLCAVVAGENWRFGHLARGHTGTLLQCAARHGFEAVAVPPVMMNGEPVSSTRIRAAIRAGRVEEAAELLGRPFCLRGPVEHGRAIGRSLGYPTANIDALRALHPPPAVYAALVEAHDSSGSGLPIQGAAAYIGHRPSVSPTEHPALEAHLFDYAGDLYGRVLTLHFLARLRDDQAFDSADALRRQIALDLERIRALSARALASVRE